MKLAKHMAIARRTAPADGLGLNARAAAGPQAIATNVHAAAIQAVRTEVSVIGGGIIARCYVAGNQRCNVRHTLISPPFLPGGGRRASFKTHAKPPQ